MKDWIVDVCAEHNVGSNARDEDIITVKKILAERLWQCTKDSVRRWLSVQTLAIIPRLSDNFIGSGKMTDKEMVDVCRYMGCGISPIRISNHDFLPPIWSPLETVRETWEGWLLIDLNKGNPFFWDNVASVVEYCMVEDDENFAYGELSSNIHPFWQVKLDDDNDVHYISRTGKRCSVIDDVLLSQLKPSQSGFLFGVDDAEPYNLTQWRIGKLRRGLLKGIGNDYIKQQIIKDSKAHYFRQHGWGGALGFERQMKNWLWDKHWELSLCMYIDKEDVETEKKKREMLYAQLRRRLEQDQRNYEAGIKEEHFCYTLEEFEELLRIDSSKE